MAKIEPLPAWSLLARSSVTELLARPDGGPPSVIRLGLGLDAISTSKMPLLVTLRLMLVRAQATGGLTLTATHAVSRADTRALFDALDWPDYDKAQVLAANKVLNEADVMPVETTRLIAQAAKFLRRRERKLLTTKVGKDLAVENHALELFQRLFALVFWRIDLGSLDRVPIDRWPQDHVGLVLWCLSVAAREWSSIGGLLPVCTVIDAAAEAAAPDFLAFAFECRILRPLTWFGLLETRRVGEPGSFSWRYVREYRTTSLFDRALTFEVEIAQPSGLRH
ncbi:hypothetical protein [Methylobacterium sp. PvR107]|uniref:hypothetical protein n=1 Tax=Methylobacterium sp. PvR107 TaxID=2806597 RepID=UPI001AE4F585|nr:hypothetical protein [Methylobacterium sp. PvR107]MBP1180929.1 hypothetical protein [Methylobacterium sp. PvR107]